MIHEFTPKTLLIVVILGYYDIPYNLDPKYLTENYKIVDGVLMNLTAAFYLMKNAVLYDSINNEWSLIGEYGLAKFWEIDLRFRRNLYFVDESRMRLNYGQIHNMYSQFLVVIIGWCISILVFLYEIST